MRFGVEIGKDGEDTNPWRYCGEYWDEETVTVYLRARSYSPGIGRFTTEDSVRGKDNDPLSLNLYTYCRNNPIFYSDYDGHIAVSTLILIGSVIIGALAAGYTMYQSHRYTGRVDWVATITQGLSWFMLAYTIGMSAYAIYLTYCDYKGITPVTEVKFNGNAQMSTGNDMSGGYAYGGNRNPSLDFRNQKGDSTLDKHFTEHNSDFGFLNSSEYAKAANNFLSRSPSSTTLSFISNEGTYFRYDYSTNEFGIMNQYGGISTYFKPKDGMDYWLNEVIGKYK
jgi:RHS repeat-associated protein